MNLRDLGGYPTGDGGLVRRRQLYRSDHLNLVTDAGLDALRGLGLRTVLDLRMPVERERQPSRLPEGLDIVHPNPIGADGAAQVELLEEVKAGRVSTITVADVVGLYIAMLGDAHQMFGDVMRTLAEPNRLPALFHCTAGKDRTGLAAALLLDLVGVDESTIVADYELTTHYRSKARIAELRGQLAPLGIDVEQIIPLLVAPPEALRAALDWIADRGGTELYLTDVCGVSPTDLIRLREILVE